MPMCAFGWRSRRSRAGRRPRTSRPGTVARGLRNRRAARLFYFFKPFLRKIFTSRPFLERFKKMDPELGAVDHGADLTCLGATDHGAEVLGL
jgi:hypothetical protein